MAIDHWRRGELPAIIWRARRCLKLILACVVYWQAKEISKAVRWCQPETEKLDITLLEHVSPIERDNVILYGQCV